MGASTDEMLAADARAAKARLSILRDSLPATDESAGPSDAAVQLMHRSITTVPLWSPRADAPSVNAPRIVKEIPAHAHGVEKRATILCPHLMHVPNERVPAPEAVKKRTW